MAAIIARVASVIRNLTRRSRIEHDLDEELRATVEMLAAEKVRAGHTPDAAHRAALVELGGIETIKEGVRDVRSGALLDTVAQDVRYGVRLLRRYPLFAMTAALSLAVGIGANTAVFTIGNSLLRFSPVAVSEPERLVDIGRSFDGLPIGFNPASYPDYLDLRRRTTTLEHVYAHPLFPKDMTVESAAGTEKVVGDVVTTNYFSALGTRAAIGRLFLPEESDAQGASPLVVLSHRYWVRSFNADPGIVGQTVRLNRYPVIVVGVAPEGFQGTTVVAVDLWVPMSIVTFVTGSTPGGLEDRRAGWVVIGARLKPGTSIEQATADVAGIDRALRIEYPNQSHPQPFRLLPASPMADKMPLAAAALLLLGAIASTVLVIACANVAGLLLARASGRGREMALRLAVGANRSRLIRQLLTETLLLFAIGAVAGIALARAMTTGLMSLLPALPVPVHLSLALDWRVVALACSLAFFAALLSGLAPALHASRADVSTVLKDEGHGASARLRMRSAFVVAQVSLSLVLVFVGGLFTRALQQASSTNAGFDARGVEVASIDASLGRDGDAASPSIARDLLDRVRHIPGVASASMSRMLPLANEAMGMGLSLPGEVPRPGAPAQTPGSGNIVAPGYFATLRIPIRAGRDFTDQDAAGAPLVAIVGEAAARRFWPGEDPIGKQLIVNGGSRPGASIRVVGVAHDVRYRALDFGTVPYVYLPLGQHDTSNLSLIVRSADGRSVAGGVRAAIAGMRAAPQSVSLQSLDDLVAVALTPQRVGAFVAGGLGLVGVLLAAIGIYGVTAYTVSRRTREIAIRTALGAQRGTLVGLVLRQAISLTAIGCAIGLVLGAVAGQVLSMLLVGVSPLDPATLGGAVVLCVVVVLAGSFVPVSRVMKIAASDALRSE
jgi:predicted permease